jgi:hypothetical protein
MKSKFFLWFVALYCFLAISLKVEAQNIISDLETSKVDEGTIHIVCDPKIIELLGTPATSPHSSESILGDETSARVGYRIQIYMDNSPKAKNEAIRIESLFKEMFSDVTAYVRYNAPNWKVLVGDFRTREEAVVFEQTIRSFLPEFGREMYIVPSRINLPVQK